MSCPSLKLGSTQQWKWSRDVPMSPIDGKNGWWSRVVSFIVSFYFVIVLQEETVLRQTRLNAASTIVYNDDDLRQKNLVWLLFLVSKARMKTAVDAWFGFCYDHHLLRFIYIKKLWIKPCRTQNWDIWFFFMNESWLKTTVQVLAL